MPLKKVNGIDLFYEDQGRGRAVVFLHGYTGSGEDWKNQVEALSPHYRTITVDHRGHGKSEAPKREEDYSIKIFSEDVYGILNGLGINECCLVGHSMGGFMSLQMVLDHPGPVKALVLVDTSSGEFERAPGYAELRARLDELARTDGLAAAFEYDAAHNPMRIERFQKYPEMREISLRKVLNTSVEGYVFAPKSFGSWKPVTDRLPEINVPTLIVVGEEDAPFIRASQIMNDSIKNSELAVIEGAGHSPHEEASDRFNHVLTDFFKRIKW